MFAVIAIAFIVLSGPTLSRLVAAKGSTLRFSLTFAFAFLAYAIVWCISGLASRGSTMRICLDRSSALPPLPGSSSSVWGREQPGDFYPIAR